MSFAVCGSQTVAEYSRIGRTKALYAVSLVFLFPISRFLLRKPSVLFALLVMVSMWGPQFRLSCMLMPRYFVDDLCTALVYGNEESTGSVAPLSLDSEAPSDLLHLFKTDGDVWM